MIAQGMIFLSPSSLLDHRVLRNKVGEATHPKFGFQIAAQVVTFRFSGQPDKHQLQTAQHESVARASDCSE